MNRISIVRILVAGALLYIPVSSAQTTDAAVSGDRLVEEIAGVNRSLGQLVVLVQALQQTRDVEILLRRIELKESRLAPLERQLRSAEDDVFNAKAEIQRMQTMLKQMENEMEERIRKGADPGDAERQMLDEVRAHIKGEVERFDELVSRQRRLEDDLSEGRKEVAILDDRLAELLGE